MRGLRNKLRRDRGETIAEGLAALLIASVALLMLATMIAGASRIASRSRERMDAYVAENNALSAQALSGERIPGTVTVKAGGAPVPLSPGSESTQVAFFYNGNDSAPVISYRKAESGG